MLKEQRQSGKEDNPEISIQEVQEWLKKYGVFAGIAALIVLMILTGVVGFHRNKERARSEAGMMLFQQADMGEIINRYPNTPYAPIARLAFASELYHTGNFDGAEHVYSEFIEANPRHPLLPVAELGKINCIAAKGLASEALARYEEFIKTCKDEFLVHQAILAKGQCLQRMGRLLEAKAVYEDFMVAYPDSVWFGTANSALTLVEQQLRRAQQS